MCVFSKKRKGDSMSNELIIRTIEVLFLIVIMVFVSVIDIRDRIIPNIASISLVIGWLDLLVLKAILLWVSKTGKDKFIQCFDKESIIQSLTGLVITILLTILIKTVLNSEAFGTGDVKLMMALSIYQGISTMLNALAYTSIIIVPVALWLLLVKKKPKDYTLPFAPFLAAGSILAQIGG